MENGSQKKKYFFEELNRQAGKQKSGLRQEKKKALSHGKTKSLGARKTSVAGAPSTKRIFEFLDVRTSKKGRSLTLDDMTQHFHANVREMLGILLKGEECSVFIRAGKGRFKIFKQARRRDIDRFFEIDVKKIFTDPKINKKVEAYAKKAEIVLPPIQTRKNNTLQKPIIAPVTPIPMDFSYLTRKSPNNPKIKKQVKPNNKKKNERKAKYEPDVFAQRNETDMYNFAGEFESHEQSDFGHGRKKTKEWNDKTRRNFRSDIKRMKKIKRDDPNTFDRMAMK